MTSLPPKDSLLPNSSPTWVYALILFVVSIAVYSNTFKHIYALDDGIIIEQNSYVYKGFAGFKKIFTRDSYQSFYAKMGIKQQLSGGRYRPLSVATFAIEEEIAGIDSSDVVTWKDSIGVAHKGYFISSNKLGQAFISPTDTYEATSIKKTSFKELDQYKELAHLRHVNNVVLYAISIVFLFYFLNNGLLKQKSFALEIAFMTSLLFALHPIHTEVVANVKSRDEIMSMLFVIATLYSMFKWVDVQKTIYLIASLICLFLGLLSKEYSVILIILLPISLYYFRDLELRKSISLVGYMVAVFLVYYMIRYNALGPSKNIKQTDILNDPYLFANTEERIATKIYVLLQYVKLLFLPHPLSSDYSFKHFDYQTFGKVWVWVSIFIHLALLYIASIQFKKKTMLSFCIIVYIGFMVLVSNMLFDIGATMGERLVYHASIGFSLLSAYFIWYIVDKIHISISSKRILIAFIVLIISGLYIFKTIDRNKAWATNTTLFITDVNTVPNSVLVNGNVGQAYVDMAYKVIGTKDSLLRPAYLKKGIVHLDKATKLHPSYANGFMNLGVVYYNLNNLDSASICWKKAHDIFPRHFLYKVYANFLFIEGMKKGAEREFEKAYQHLSDASILDPEDADIWANLGGAAFSCNRFEQAKKAWEQALAINPNHNIATRGYPAVINVLAQQKSNPQ